MVTFYCQACAVVHYNDVVLYCTATKAACNVGSAVYLLAVCVGYSSPAVLAVSVLARMVNRVPCDLTFVSSSSVLHLLVNNTDRSDGINCSLPSVCH